MSGIGCKPAIRQRVSPFLVGVLARKRPLHKCALQPRFDLKVNLAETLQNLSEKLSRFKGLTTLPYGS